VSLAEGLGYGREREAFRAVGEELVTLAPGLTSPAHVYEGLQARLSAAPRLDRQRLAARWRERGTWPELWSLLSRPQVDDDREALLRVLTISSDSNQVSPRQSASPDESLSAERAAILVWNVALPFAYGWALLHEDEVLAKRAYVLALEFPGLPSNQITRTQQRQLLLGKHPRMALAQQGLHYVQKHWYREKICSARPCAKGEEYMSNLRSIGDGCLFQQELGIPNHFPEMIVGVFKVASIAAQKGPSCRFDDLRSCASGLLHHRIHLCSQGNDGNVWLLEEFLSLAVF
jgi:hypothetical protein